MNLFQIEIIRKDTGASFHITPMGEMFDGIPVLDQNYCFESFEAALAQIQEVAEELGLDNIDVKATRHYIDIYGKTNSSDLDLTRCKIELVREYNWTEWTPEGFKEDGTEIHALDALVEIENEICLEDKDVLSLIVPITEGGGIIGLRRFG
jgi:hypothetical protein